MSNNIVISAIGFNSPYGVGKNTYWEKINNFHRINKNLSPIIEEHDPQNFLNPKGQKFLNKATLIYCNVAFQAIHERELTNVIEQAPERIGLYDGSELSNLEDCFVFDLTAKNEGTDRVSPMRAPNTIANAAASQMAIQAGIKGANFSVCSGAAGSLQAMDIAYIHLKQNIVDYAIVTSTEVNNKYQQSILEGEGREQNFNAPEIGASLILEREDSVKEQKKESLATIKQINSTTQLNDETRELLLYRLIEQASSKNTIDMLIISGGQYNIDSKLLDSILNKNSFNIPTIYPEKILGDNDNAGGILGIIYAIGILKNKINIVDSEISKIDNSEKNILITSIDQSGTAISVVVSK